MTNHSHKPLIGLFAIGAALMMPLAFAQDTAPPPTSPAATMHEGAVHEPMKAPAPNTTAASNNKSMSWNDLDANKDGKLSKDEVAGDPTWSKDFDAADTNKDGYISKDEYTKHVADLKKVAKTDSKK